MLEGVAESLQQVVRQLSSQMLLYCPAASEKNFQNALAYLIRRLDENTGPENFLRALFHLTLNSKEWQKQSTLFVDALQSAQTTNRTLRRQQNRLQNPAQPAYDTPFENEPDTDWTLTPTAAGGSA